MPAPGLVVGGVIGLQSGAALATRLYADVGPAGIVTLRLCLAAVALGVLWRPGLRWERGTLVVIATAGALLAIHHLSYYEAIGRIPLGAATTIEFLGPFVISVVGSRRPTDLLWSVLAVAGVLFLGTRGLSMNRVGIAFAAVAACCWAAYILVSAQLARRVSDGRGLAVAVAWGALLSLPYGIVQAGPRLLSPRVLLLAAVVAALSSVLPYSFNLEALRRIPPRVFGILTCLEPAVGAIIGLVVLSQHLTPLQYAGVTTVVLASAGASWTTTRATAT